MPKILFLQANVSTSIEQVVLAMAPRSIPWPLSEWASDPLSVYFGGKQVSGSIIPRSAPWRRRCESFHSAAG